MKICLVSSEHSPWGGIGHALRRLAGVLAERHEVTLIHGGVASQDEYPSPPSLPGVNEVRAEPSADFAAGVFACEEHRQSAAVLEAIERAYGAVGPDYLGACDYRAPGLVPLQARRAGHPLLRETLIGIWVSSAAELIGLHDGVPRRSNLGIVGDLEREQLRLADRLVWPGGDILDLYRRYYAPLALPEAVRIRRPFRVPAGRPAPRRRDPRRPLELLFVGRLQGCKGAIDLAAACLDLPAEDWRLTMIGADTLTAPMGQSVRMTIEAMAGGDPRIQLRDPIPHAELAAVWDEHDLLVMPSRFDVWPNVAIEAMRAGMPILATPVGGLCEIVEPGVTGWLADDAGAEALCRALASVLEDREGLERIRSSGAIFDRFLGLTDPEGVLVSYESMLDGWDPGPARSPAAAAAEPLVTAVVPYHGSSAYIEEAVSSLLGQTHSNLEVLIVNDGSFAESDDVLGILSRDPRVDVVTQLNRGEPSARNLGASLARGEYLAMLDADNALEPEFVARAIEVFEREPDLAYMTSWLRFVAADGSPAGEPSMYAPLGNRVVADDTSNRDGDAIAVLPRRIFSELGYRYEPSSGIHSDWELYRRLRDDGRFGAVIPELLARYRDHAASLTKSHRDDVHERSWNEARSRRLRRSTRWTAEAGDA